MDQHNLNKNSFYIEWLLNLATSIHSKFYDDTIENTIEKYINEYIKNNNNSCKLIKNTILNNDSPFFIISKDIKSLYYFIIKKIKENLSSDEKSKFKPLTIITKLEYKEYVLDISGNIIIYGVNSNYFDDNLTKSMICKSLYSVKNYFNQINKDNNLILNDSITPILNNTNKLNKQIVNKQVNNKLNIKIKILNNLINYIKNNSNISESIIFLTDIKYIDNHAMDMIFSDYKTKDSIVDYLKTSIKMSYSNDYLFEYNDHKNYFIPYDFRLKKLSCFIKHRKTNQVIYLINLYNTATYDPIPCYKIIDDKKNYELTAHPLVKLRFLYLDKYFLNSIMENKTKISSFELLLDLMINEELNKLKKNDKAPIWCGMYRDEKYDKNQKNMRYQTMLPYEIVIV